MQVQNSYQFRARREVVRYFNEHRDKTDTFLMQMENVYVVWFTFVLGNWKALLSTDVPDGMYYEATYNKDKHEMYLDAYKKINNVSIPDDDTKGKISQVSAADLL